MLFLHVAPVGTTIYNNWSKNFDKRPHSQTQTLYHSYETSHKHGSKNATITKWRHLWHYWLKIQRNIASRLRIDSSNLDPHLIHGSLDPHESPLKRHLDRVSHSCRAHECDTKHTDTQTDHATPSVAIARMRCGLLIITGVISVVCCVCRSVQRCLNTMLRISAGCGRWTKGDAALRSSGWRRWRTWMDQQHCRGTHHWRDQYGGGADVIEGGRLYRTIVLCSRAERHVDWPALHTTASFARLRDTDIFVPSSSCWSTSDSS